HLSQLQKKYEDKDVYIVGITDERDEAKIKNFVTSQGPNMTYTVAIDSSLDARQKLFAASGARGIPFSLIVDSDNVIVWSGHPAEPEFEEKLDQAARAATPRKSSLTPLPAITQSYDELMSMSVKDLKKILADRKISATDCLEKGDLAKRIVDRCKGVTYYQE
ncbi:hypothetical protein HK104_000310, partial [Borealophlyctis nickersoniae]